MDDNGEERCTGGTCSSLQSGAGLAHVNPKEWGLCTAWYPTQHLWALLRPHSPASRGSGKEGVFPGQ